MYLAKKFLVSAKTKLQLHVFGFQTQIQNVKRIHRHPVIEPILLQYVLIKTGPFPIGHSKDNHLVEIINKCCL